MNRILLLILLLLPIFKTTGQTLKGTVIDGETGNPLIAVTVLNMNTRQYAYTDASGTFTITASKGDQVSFSFIGYKTQQKTVPAAIGAADMQIELFRMSYQLEEFIYRPKFTPYQIDSMERKSTYQRALARQKGGSVMSPVTFLAEKLSKRSRQIFKFQKSFNYWEEERFIESRYSPQLVAQLTGLKGDTLAYFINANPLPYDYARVASELELKMWIRERYKEWAKTAPHPLPKGLPVDSSLSARDSLSNGE